MTDVVGEIAEIRKELRTVRWYLPEGLREEASAWIEASYDKSDADTARGYVESNLNRLLAEHPMYHAPELSRGEDGFPARCRELECKHVGGACPVLRDETETRWRERQLEGAETEAEVRQIYQRQAIDVGCPLIPEMLDEWDNEHADFIQEGNRILARAEDAIAADDDLDGDTDDLDDLGAAVPDGGLSDG
jgi:hypothetical protein